MTAWNACTRGMLFIAGAVVVVACLGRVLISILGVTIDFSSAVSGIGRFSTDGRFGRLVMSGMLLDRCGPMGGRSRPTRVQNERGHRREHDARHDTTPAFPRSVQRSVPTGSESNKGRHVWPPCLRRWQVSPIRAFPCGRSAFIYKDYKGRCQTCQPHRRM